MKFSGFNTTEKVGIGFAGTSLPDQTLVVKASLPVVALESSNNQSRIDFRDGSTIQATIGLNPTHGDSFNIALGGSLTSDVKLLVKPDGKVGIGTTAPANIVDVRGSGTPTLAVRNTGTSTNATLHLGEVNQTAYGVELRYEGNLGNLFLDNRYNHATRPHMYFRMRVAGTPIVAMTIDPAGNVGIGTTSPSVGLEVAKTSADASFKVNRTDQTNIQLIAAGSSYVRASAALILQSNGANNRLTLAADGSSTFSGSLKATTILDASNSAGTNGQVLTSTGSALDWKTLSEISGVDGSGTANYIPKWTDSDTIGNSSIHEAGAGSLQIEGPSAGRFLTLNAPTTGGYITFETADTAFADIGTAKAISGNAAYSTTDLMINTRSGTKNIVFGMNGVEKVRIDNNGKVGIGTTNPGGKLEVDGSSVTVPLLVKAGTGANSIKFVGRSTDNISSLDFFQNNGSSGGGFFQSNGTWMRVRADGGVHFRNGNTPVTTSSDFTINGMSLGIGTTAPAALLQVGASGTGGGGVKIYGATNGNPLVMYEDTNNAITHNFHLDVSDNAGLIMYAASAVPKVSIQTSGNSYFIGGKVGIGTTAPAVGLEVHHNAENGMSVGRADDGTSYIESRVGNVQNRSSGFFGCVGSTANTGISSTNCLGGTRMKVLNDGGSLQGEVQFFTNSGQSLDQRVVINKDGKVGIGTAAPARLLHINGANDVARFQGSGSNYIDIDGNGTQLSCTTNLSFRASVSGDAMMTIKTDGKVGIGTDPSYKFEVVTGTSEVGFEYDTHANGTQTIKFNPSSTKAGGTSKIYSSYAGTGATEGKLALGTYSDQTALVIDGGKVLIGGSTALGPFGEWNWTPLLQQLGTQGIVTVRCGADVYGGAMHLASARGSNASPTIVLNGDRAGGVYYHAYDGVNFSNTPAAIECFIDGAPAADDTPGRLVFSTAPDGSNSITERMRITSAGKVGIGTTSPSAKLDVSSPAGTGVALAVKGGNNLVDNILLNLLNQSGTTVLNVRNNGALYGTAATFSGRIVGNDFEMLDSSGTGRTLVVRHSGNQVQFGDGSTFSIFRFNGTQVIPHADSTATLGTNALRWSTIYGDAGNFSEVMNLSGVNKIHQLSGHNFLQGDATMTYLYGGSGGGQIRTANNASSLIQWLDNGKVGIGNTSPDFKLEVGNAGGTLNTEFRIVGEKAISAAVSGISTYLWADGTTHGLNAWNYAGGAHPDLYIGWAGKNVLLNALGAGGKVGINTVSPSGLIHLKQLAADHYGEVIEASGNDAWIRMGHNGTYGAIHTTYHSSAGATPLILGNQNNMTTQLVLATNNNVGIGTAAPGAKLDVAGAVHISPDTAGKDTIRLTTNAANDGSILIKSDTTTKVDIQANGNTYFNGGKVGIGTTTPGSELDIEGSHTAVNEGAPYGTGSTHINLKNTSDTDGNLTGVLFEGAVGTAYMGGMYMEMENHSSFHSKLHFATRNAGSFGSKMVLAKDGKVGIGTANPTQQLMVWQGSSSVSFGEFSNGAVIWLDGVNGDLSGGDYFNIWADGNSALRFGYGTAQKVSMLSSGRFGIGVDTPSNLLSVEGSVSGDYLAEFKQGHSTAGQSYGVNITAGTNASDQAFRVANQAEGTLLQVCGDGEIRVAGQTLVDNSLTNYKMTFPNLSGIAMGSAYTYANIYGSGGDLYLKANAYGANLGNNPSKIYLVTAGNSGSSAPDVVVKGGKVGIGNDNPFFPFTVYGATGFNGEAKNNALLFDTASATTGTGGGLAFGGYSNGTGGDIYHFGNIQGIKENSTAGNYASAMLFSTRANGATPLVRMRITSAGKVGIGTTPDSLLQIANANGSSYRFGYAGTSDIYFDADDVYFRSDTGGVNNMVLKGSKLGIGTATPAALLNVYSAIANANGIAYVKQAVATNNPTLVVEQTVSGGNANVNQGLVVRAVGTGDGSGNTLHVYRRDNSTTGLVVKGSGNVGIGTVIAPNLLTLKGDSKYLAMYASDGSEAVRLGVDSSGDGQLRLMDGGGNTRIFFYGESGANSYINNGGKVGIGTDAPSSPLQVTIPASQGLTDFGGVTFQETANRRGLSMGWDNSSGYFWFYSRDVGVASRGINLNNALYVKSLGGNVGIGVTAPGAKLHVTGAPGNSTYLSYLFNSATHSEANGLNVQIASSGSSAMGLRVNTGGDSNAFIVAGDGDTGLGFTPSNFAQKLNVNGGAYINGFVGIGTASTMSSSAELLGVYSASNGHASFKSSSDSTGTVYIRNVSQTANTWQPYLILADSGGNRGGLALKYSTAGLKVHGQGGIEFWTGSSFGAGTLKMTIASGGTVSVSSNFTIPQGNLLYLDGGSNTYIYSDTADSIAIATGGSVRMTINSNGTVFMPNGKAFAFKSSSGVIQSVLSLNSSNAMVLGGTGMATNAYPIRNIAKYITFEPAGGLGVGIETMRITNASFAGVGSVGIGTNAPTAPLEVRGADSGITISSASSSRPHLRLVNGTTNMLQLSANGAYAAIGDGTDANRYMSFKGGSVGIGTTDPGTLLDVNGRIQTKTLAVVGDGSNLPFLSTSGGEDLGSFYSTLTTYARLRINIATGGDSQISFMSNSVSKWSIGNDGGDSHKFKIKVGLGAFSGAEKFMIQADGNIGIGTNAAGYKFHVQGDILASGSIMGNSKSFVIDHPTKPNSKLQYGALEGPEFGVYYRGRAQSNTITLPDYWTALVREETITVQLTSNGSFQHLYVVSQSLTEVVIGAADGETIDCFYTIYAERADIDRLEVEKEV